MTTASARLAMLGAIAAVSGCSRAPCPELPQASQADAFALADAIENVRWQLQTVDGESYSSHAGGADLFFHISEPGVYIRSFHTFNTRLWCHRGGERIFERRGDEVFPTLMSLSRPFNFQANCKNPQGLDAAVEDVLDHPFRLALHGDELWIRGPRNLLVYRAVYAAPVASGPLIGTWRMESGPEEFTSLNFRVHFAENRELRARWDCMIPDSCRTHGTFGLACDGQTFTIRLRAAPGPEPIARRVVVLNDARSAGLDGDRLIIETADDFFVFLRVDREPPLAPNRADW